MLKLLVFVAGLAAGVGGAASWLLSEPVPAPTAPSQKTGDESLEARLAALKARFSEARAEGERASRQSEEHLHRKLDAYRKGSSAPVP